MLSTVRPSWSTSVSRVPGAAPRTSTPAAAPVTGELSRMAPVLPFLTDSPQQLEETVRRIAAAGAAHVAPIVLHLRPGAREWFLGWLGEHFPFISWRNIIFCGDKSIIGTDFMIDDHIKNLDYFKGKTIMFNAFHNVNHTHHQRVKNWDEVLELMAKEL